MVNATTHAIRNKKIETAKLSCFLNSLSPSLIRGVRRKKTARMKRKSGIAAATKAIILKIMVDPCQLVSTVSNPVDDPQLKRRHHTLPEAVRPGVRNSCAWQRRA